MVIFGGSTLRKLNHMSSNLYLVERTNLRFKHGYTLEHFNQL